MQALWESVRCWAKGLGPQLFTRLILLRDAVGCSSLQSLFTADAGEPRLFLGLGLLGVLCWGGVWAGRPLFWNKSDAKVTLKIFWNYKSQLLVSLWKEKCLTQLELERKTCPGTPSPRDVSSVAGLWRRSSVPRTLIKTMIEQSGSLSSFPNLTSTFSSIWNTFSLGQNQFKSQHTSDFEAIALLRFVLFPESPVVPSGDAVVLSWHGGWARGCVGIWNAVKMFCLPYEFLK